MTVLGLLHRAPSLPPGPDSRYGGTTVGGIRPPVRDPHKLRRYGRPHRQTRAKKADLLTVLRHSDMPLHNNSAELGARVNARRRDISLQTKNILDTRTLDTLTSIVQAAKKLGVRTYEHLCDRITHRMPLPSLATLVQSAAARTLSSIRI